MPLARIGQSEKIISCLVIGPVGSGKSCLLKMLQAVVSSDKSDPEKAMFENMRTFATIYPTVGTEMHKIQVPTKRILASNCSGRIQWQIVPAALDDTVSKSFSSLTVNFREIGGSLQALWPRYYSEADAICIVIDANNLLSPSGGSGFSLVSLASILADYNLKNIPILICLSKVEGKGNSPTSDQTLTETIDIASIVLNIEHLLQARSKLCKYDAVICTSAKTNVGLFDIFYWLSGISAL